MRLAVMGALVGASPARADDMPRVPEVPEPTCVSRHCACDLPGVQRSCDTDCAALCGGGDDASGGTTGGTRPQQGVPPILKLAAVTVAAAVIVGMFAVAPGHTSSLFGTRASAASAREAWRAHQDALEELIDAGARAGRQARAYDAAVRVDPRPPRVRVAASYVAIAPRSTVDRWAPHSTCGELLRANAELLERADREAYAQARSQFPTTADVTAAAKQAAREGLLNLVGAKRYAKQRAELEKRYREAKELAAFMDEMGKCVADPDQAASHACLLKLSAKVNEELEPLVDEFQPGTGDAHARVRKAATFYRGYITGLERDLEKQALLAARCGS